MKNLIIICILFSSIFCFSQQKVDSISVNDLSKTASYKSGNEKFKKDLERAVDYAVDGNYVVYGTMTFTFLIDETGKAKIVDVKPRLKNSQKLIDDLNYLLKRSNKNWEPARKDGKAVPSHFNYQIKFNTEVYDHD